MGPDRLNHRRCIWLLRLQLWWYNVYHFLPLRLVQYPNYVCGPIRRGANLFRGADPDAFQVTYIDGNYHYRTLAYSYHEPLYHTAGSQSAEMALAQMSAGIAAAVNWKVAEHVLLYHAYLESNWPVAWVAAIPTCKGYWCIRLCCICE